MATRHKIVAPEVQMISIEPMDGLFPFEVIVIYKEKTSIEDIIREAATKDTNLAPLANELDNRLFYSMVFKRDGSTVAYLVMDDRITIDTLVHECNHLTFRLFEIIGSPITEDSEELFAYINGYFFKKIYEVIVKLFKLNPEVILIEKE